MSAGAAFLGFPRADGGVGVRNHLLVLSTTGLTGAAARRIGVLLAEARVVTTPFGSGVVGEDGRLRERLLLGFACHPNVGAVLLLSGKPPEAAALAESVAKTGRTVTTLVLDEYGQDALRLTEAGVRAGAQMVRNLSRERRKPAPLSALFVAGECGRSDPSSGLVSNPLVGSVADAVVDAGGRFVIGETMEWFGAEHLLARRASSPDVARAIHKAVRRRVEHASDSGIDLLGNNPGPTNIAHGLSTLEEKSLGAVMKSGSRCIEGVLKHGERPPGAGLWLMDQPFYAPESLSGMVAAGAQLALFTSGPGNSFSSLLAPTIKLSANPQTCERLTEQIDFDASAVLAGHRTLEEAAHALFKLSLEVASGYATFGEILGEGEEVVSRQGASL